MIMQYREWLKSEDGERAKLNWDNAGDYGEDDYEDYLMDKFQEYKLHASIPKTKQEVDKNGL